MKNWIWGLGFLFCWLSVNAEEQILRHRAYLGMGYGAVTPEEATAYKLPDANGLLIKRILTNGPAAQAGIRIGDVLRSLDSNSVTGESEFRDMLRKHYSGDTITAGLIREVRSVSVRLTAGSFPEEKAEGLDIEYCAFSSAGTLLRAVLAAPAGTH
jgi:S1-C subfamily serine protease